MAQPGWYPDPTGAAGQYRYWNGTSWTTDTTAAPQQSGVPASPAVPSYATHSTQPQPTIGSTAPAFVPTVAQPASGKSRKRGLLGAGALALVAVTVAALVIGNSGHGAPEDTNTSHPTGPSWNEKSPTPTLTPLAAPTHAGKGKAKTHLAPHPQHPSAAPTGNLCDQSSGNLVAHPSDGRVHGGHLSIQVGSGWQSEDEYGLAAFTSDATLEFDNTALLAVGQVAKADGFVEPHMATRRAMNCFIGSLTDGDDVFKTLATPIDRATTVDGKSGWWLREQILWTDDGVPAHTEFEMLIVDTGDPDALSFWFSFVTTDEGQGDRKTVDAVRQTMQVDPA